MPSLPLNFDFTDWVVQKFRGGYYLGGYTVHFLHLTALPHHEHRKQGCIRPRDMTLRPREPLTQRKPFEVFQGAQCKTQARPIATAASTVCT